MGSISAVQSNPPLTVAAVNELTVDVGFSTTIKGKTYDADATYSSGEYTASDPSLSGAEATGADLPDAEKNLTALIDTLV